MDTCFMIFALVSNGTAILFVVVEINAYSMDARVMSWTFISRLAAILLVVG